MMSPVQEAATSENTYSANNTASKPKRPGSAAKQNSTTKGKIQAQRIKEREREYNVKRTALEQKMYTETKESRKQVLVKQMRDLESEYWDVIDAIAAAKSAKKPARRGSASSNKKARPATAATAKDRAAMAYKEVVNSVHQPKIVSPALGNTTTTMTSSIGTKT